MKVVIDTSSLLSLVRYYLPFDTQSKLFNFIRKEIESHNLIILDEVLKECEYTSQKLVVRKLEYLTDKNFKKTFNIPINTKYLLPPAPNKFYNLVDNNFTTIYAKKLDSVQFEQRKKEFLASADARMIIYVLTEIKFNPKEDIVIVTEETEGSNDLKAFKKIPAICKILNIKVKTLPELLEEHNGINFEFN